MEDAITAAIVRISDPIVEGEKTDHATPYAQERLEQAGVNVISKQLVRDDTRDIVEAVSAAGIAQVDVIITLGGTGLSPLDYTIRAMDTLFRFDIPGIPAAIRAYGWNHGNELSALWRGRAGVLVSGMKRIFVLNSAGTKFGIQAALDVVLPILPDIVARVAGEQEGD